jgi:dienelactone hydrolase
MGWINWPDSEDLSIEFMRLLGAAQEGGSTVSECFLTASRIDPKDDDCWHREWKKTADASNERGNTAFSRGQMLTAQSNWLRAINYYQTAAFRLELADKRQQAVLKSMRACARRCLDHLPTGGEVVEIPWLDGYPLEGYFLPAPVALARAPVVICMGEPGHRKEEFLYKTARYARDRGMSLLAVDLLGSGTGVKFEEIVGRPDLEEAVVHLMDYLTTRRDVDERRIAILGDGAGSSFVARGVALDQRFAAAVCDGGIWDLHERAFLMERISPFGAESGERIGDSIARKFKCPVLVTVGEDGWLEAGRVQELFEKLKRNHRDITLKIFSREETAASQGHFDNPTLANEFIFDWIADRLNIAAGQRHLPVQISSTRSKSPAF